MRKRLLIGAIAAVAIGAGALGYWGYVQGREKSIEYHKAEYLAARDGRPMNIVRKAWHKLTGQIPQRAPQRMDVGKLIRHEKALLRLGYWREETLVVSRPAGQVCGIAAQNGKSLWHPDFTKEVCVMAPIGTNTIIVRAVPDHIPIWERLIRDADTGQLK